MRSIILAIVVIACVASSQAKVASRSEVTSSLKKYGVPQNKIETWLCIVQHESEFKTNAHNTQSGDHGIYQISEIYWCSNNSQPGKACHETCASFRDDDIDNDTRCAMQIYEEWERLHGNGFLAWVAYKYCH